MRRQTWCLVAVGALWACGGSTISGIPGGDGGSSSSSSSGGSSGGSSGSGSGGSSSDGSSSGSGSGSGSGSSSGVSSSSSSGGSSSGSGGSSSGSMRVPLNHRPDDSQCQQAAPPGDCPIKQGMFVPCTMDSQCTMGTNGRCVTNNGGALTCNCTYDTCVHDGDCMQGETCGCHGSPYTYGQGNTCVPGNCRVDSDCGPNGYCSPSYDTSGCGGLAGYYCHTAADQCIDDSDCPQNMGPPVCVYSGANMRWQCDSQKACP